MSATPWMVGDAAQRKDAMRGLLRELFPIHRTLVNDGYDRSLELIGRSLPIDVLAYPSGSRVWDWVIPNAWDVREAYIEDLDGRRLVDFRDSNLHLSAYSVAYTGEVARDELLRHIATLPDRPDAIPYNYLYYDRGWQFNVAHRDLARLTAERYRVVIDVHERPGELKIGTFVLSGESSSELLVSTYLCHPSMANDNLSGVVTSVELFRRLAEMERRRHTYRLIIVPETIGAVTWLAHHEDILDRVLGALVVYDCGDPGPIHYKRSWFGGARVDRIAEHVLRHNAPGSVVLPWHASGSDERQFNAPGVRIPAGSFMRTPAGGSAVYHTSNDTLDYVTDDALLDSLENLYAIVRVLESDRTYANEYRGEPCFSRHGIEYPSYHGDRGDEVRLLVKKLIYELDGSRSLLEIAERLDEPMHHVVDLARSFCNAGLIREIPASGSGRHVAVEPKSLEVTT